MQRKQAVRMMLDLHVNELQEEHKQECTEATCIAVYII